MRQGRSYWNRRFLPSHASYVPYQVFADAEAGLSALQKGSEQAKGLAQQSLSAGMRASRDNTALMLEEAARMNGAAVRKAFEQGLTRMEETIEASCRIAWLSLAASAVAFMAAVCAIFVHVIH